MTKPNPQIIQGVSVSGSTSANLLKSLKNSSLWLAIRTSHYCRGLSGW